MFTTLYLYIHLVLIYICTHLNYYYKHKNRIHMNEDKIFTIPSCKLFHNKLKNMYYYALLLFFVLDNAMTNS